jgi:hypothetical protein
MLPEVNSSLLKEVESVDDPIQLTVPNCLDACVDDETSTDYTG